jgi:hypothetical protein
LFASAFGAAGPFATAEQRAYENYEHATLSTDALISVGDGYSRSWGSLWNALYDLLNPYFLGFRTVINTTSGKLNAEIIEYELEDGIVFAVSLNDVVSFKRSISLADYCTRAFITGEYDNGISDNPKPVIEFASSDGLRINQDEGFDAMLFPVWREQYIDGGGVDSVDDEGNTLTNAQFRNALKRFGIESLLANKYENVMTVNVDESRHVYRNDYRIGSIVGYQVDALFSGYDIIREVTETIERGARSIYITLGQTAPTIKQLIRSK